MKKKTQMNKTKGYTVKIILPCIISVSFLAFYSAHWYAEVYGDIGFESILFTLFSDLSGTEANLVFGWMLKALLPCCLCTAGICFVLMFDPKYHLCIEWLKLKKLTTIYPFKNWFRISVSVVLSFCLFWNAAVIVGIPDYLDGMLQKTTIYEDEYINPDNVNIKFPEQKRNLIYIFLESMETSYLSKDLGGALEYNLIPELYSLAEENINFSHNDGVGGWPEITNTTWTVGAIVGQTAGIPLSIPIDGNGYGDYDTFLPGVTTITDILNNEGYYQTFMVGSEVTYGGRDKYYKTHNIDRIYDYNTADDDGIIEEEYRVWWGFEDSYLFEYAKQVLPEIAAKEEPFAFTMLTVDTHHVDGYKCDYCGEEYSENYENVISCSSKQVYAFVEWIKQQDFYENTTVVICGDHKSMDAGYFDRNVDCEYERHMYNCFINSSVSCDDTKNREFSTMDIFPTTLAAMGCRIEGDRLGLGVNLFSYEQTLCEKYGTQLLNEELSKSSAYYMPKFVKGK